MWAHIESTTNTRPAVPEAQLESEAVRIPVDEGRELRFTRLLRSQGLSQQRVTHIVQDDRGFLWFGTQYGLNRYDGYHFRVFKHDAADPRTPCGFNVPALFKDTAGTLWIGCDGGVDRYDPTTETFVHYRLDNSKIEGMNGAVSHISEDRAGALWLSTGNGLYRLDRRTGKIARFTHLPSDPFSLSSDNVRSSGEDRAGTFWVATAEGLDAFDREQGRVTFHVPLRESRDFSFYEDRTGVFWILYASANGLAILDRKTQRLVPYAFAEPASDTPLTGVSSILEDRDGTLWIGTFSDGLLKFDRERKRFTRFRNDSANPDSLPENRITTLFEDREGNIWVGLGTTEPAFFARRPPPFTKLPFDAANPANLGETLVNVLYEDRAGSLWMGTTGALLRLDRASGHYTRFAIPGHGVNTDVLSLFEDPSGVMWVGSSGRGLYQLDPGSGQVRRISDFESAAPNATVTKLYMDHSGVLWVTTTDGLYRLEPGTQRVKTVLHSPGGYRPTTIDDHGSLWLGTYGGKVLRVDPRSEQITTFSQAGSEHSEFVNTILIDHAGSVWLGDQTGLYRLEPQSGEVTHFTEKEGLASDVVSCILEDESGALWMGTSNGLSRLDTARKVFTNYGPADGLPGPDLTGWSACFRGRSGELFFGGFSGAAAFRPQDVSTGSYTPPIALTAFRLLGEVVPANHSPLIHAIDYTDALELSNSQNSFSFEFSALAFRSPASNRYRYKLEGLDSDWHEVRSDQRLASYTTLPSGSYRFRVQGATGRGPWSEPGRAIDITIRPAWWNTWWFRALVALLLFAAAFTLYRLRVRHISRRFAIRLDERVRERTRIARELHDSLLQGVQGLMLRLHAVRELLPASPADAALALKDALRSGDQAIAEARAAVQDLRATSLAAGDLPGALMALGPELLPENSEPLPAYRVLVEGNTRPLALLVRDDSYRIAREAVRNAIQHARARRIEVQLVYGETTFCLRVCDDGVGIDAKTLEVARRSGHWGLQGMRERAQGFAAHIEVRSEPGAGTEVVLEVPAAVAYGRGAIRTSPAARGAEQP